MTPKPPAPVVYVVTAPEAPKRQKTKDPRPKRRTLADAPPAWKKVHRETTRALLLAERAALGGLRSALLTVVGDVAQKIGMFPGASHQEQKLRALSLIRQSTGRVQSLVEERVFAARQLARAASHERGKAELALLRSEFEKGGKPAHNLPVLLRTPGHDDLALAHRASTAVADAWGKAALSHTLTWQERPELSLSAAILRTADAVDPKLRMIATSETRTAFNAEHTESMRALGPGGAWTRGVFRRWDATLDRTCPACLAHHGEIVPFGQNFVGGDEPSEMHPHCFPPGEAVATPTGPVAIDQLKVGDFVNGGLTGEPRRVSALHVNHFDGELVLIKTPQGTLRLTPNHPVLTGRGWRPAGEVECSDQLYCHVEKVWIGSTNSMAFPSNYSPTECGKEGVFSPILSSLVERAMPVAGVDFDCNSGFRESEVDVPFSHLELRLRSKPGGKKGVQENRFDRREARCQGASLGAHDEPGGVVLGATSRFVRRAGKALSAPRPLSGHSHAVCLGASAAGRTGCHERTVDDGARDAKLPSDTQNRQPFADVHPANREGVEIGPAIASAVDRHAGRPHGALHDRQAPSEMPGNLQNRQTVLVEKAHLDVVQVDTTATHLTNLSRRLLVATRPLTIQRVPYCGTVHNLSVEYDESYVAGGLVVHNCRCTDTIVYMPTI